MAAASWIEQRKAWTAQGLCSCCGKNPQADSTRRPGEKVKLCVQCLANHRKAAAKRENAFTNSVAARRAQIPTVTAQNYFSILNNFTEREREIIQRITADRVGALLRIKREAVGGSVVARELLQVILYAGGLAAYLQEEAETRQALRLPAIRCFHWYFEARAAVK